MRYDIQKFKQCYASGIITLMYVEAVVFVIAVIVFALKIPYLAAVASYVFPGIIIIGLPYTFFHYLRIKRQAERQRQWISNGKFYLQRVLDCGWTGGGFVDHRVTVLFDRIDRIQVKKGYIVIEGEINLVDQFNEVVREKQVTSYKIPRTFIHEERVIGLAKGEIFDTVSQENHPAARRL